MKKTIKDILISIQDKEKLSVTQQGQVKGGSGPGCDDKRKGGN